MKRIHNILIICALSINICACSNNSKISDSNIGINSNHNDEFNQLKVNNSIIEESYNYNNETVDNTINNESVNENINNEIIDNEIVASNDDEKQIVLDNGQYIRAVRWLLNPLAGPNYWNKYYEDYSETISQELITQLINEYKSDSSKVQLDIQDVTEPEFYIKNILRLPAYVKNEDGETYSVVETSMDYNYNDYSLTYNELLDTMNNTDLYNIPIYVKSGELEYITIDYSDIPVSKLEWQSKILNGFEFISWNLQVSIDKTSNNIVVLKDIGIYNTTEIYYYCTLNSNGQIINIEQQY